MFRNNFFFFCRFELCGRCRDCVRCENMPTEKAFNTFSNDETMVFRFGYKSKNSELSYKARPHTNAYPRSHFIF